MDFNKTLKIMKLKYENNLENLLDAVITTAYEYIIKYNNETELKEKENLECIIESLRHDAFNISKELKGSITYGGRKFDNMIDHKIKGGSKYE